MAYRDCACDWNEDGTVRKMCLAHEAKHDYLEEQLLKSKEKLEDALLDLQVYKRYVRYLTGR